MARADVPGVSCPACRLTSSRRPTTASRRLLISTLRRRRLSTGIWRVTTCGGAVMRSRAFATGISPPHGIQRLMRPVSPGTTETPPGHHALPRVWSRADRSRHPRRCVTGANRADRWADRDVGERRPGTGAAMTGRGRSTRCAWVEVIAHVWCRRRDPPSVMCCPATRAPARNHACVACRSDLSGLTSHPRTSPLCRGDLRLTGGTRRWRLIPLRARRGPRARCQPGRRRGPRAARRPDRCR